MTEIRCLKLLQQSRTTNDGFTLIEVLLAVFIASIVMAVLYASFFQIIKAKEKVEEELELYHEARVIFSKITRDLVTAFPRSNLNSVSSNSAGDYFIAGQENNFSYLVFTSLSRTPAPDSKESDQTEISYFVIQNEDDPELFVLMRRDNPAIGMDERGTEYPISERIVGFTLSFLDENALNSETPDLAFEWNSNELSLPKVVNVNIILRSPRGEDIEFNMPILIPVVD